MEAVQRIWIPYSFLFFQIYWHIENNTMTLQMYETWQHKIGISAAIEVERL